MTEQLRKKKDIDHADQHAARNRRDPRSGGPTARAFVRRRLKQAGAALRAKDPAFLVTIARGSSDHAALFLKYAIELAGRSSRSLRSARRSPRSMAPRLQLGPAPHAIAISQSGKSPDIVAMAEAATEAGAVIDRAHQHPALADLARHAPIRSTSSPARKSPLLRPSPMSTPSSPALPFSANGPATRRCSAPWPICRTSSPRR